MQIAKSPRATIRFPLQAQVSFWWTDENGIRQQGEGSSRDVSELGAFLYADACPPVGSIVNLRIDLEGLPDTTGIDVEGRVIRIDKVQNGKGSSGFAVLRDLPEEPDTE